jgi:hypothetical protein
MLWLAFLVCAWSLVEYPWGFGLFGLGVANANRLPAAAH